MPKFTLHNQNGDYMHDSARTLKIAKQKCDNVKSKCQVCETYLAQSPWDSSKTTEHSKVVYRNY